jgi:ABC-type antimicrobial peptide transport system ATPase subunit
LNQVIDLSQQAGHAYGEFQRQDSAAFKRIQLGLKRRQSINGVDESGAILSQDVDEGTAIPGRL